MCIDAEMRYQTQEKKNTVPKLAAALIASGTTSLISSGCNEIQKQHYGVKCAVVSEKLVTATRHQSFVNKRKKSLDAVMFADQNIQFSQGLSDLSLVIKVKGPVVFG